MPESLLGKAVRIRFLDHAEDANEPIVCVVWGMVVKETDESFTISCWDLPDVGDECRSLNSKIFIILKSTIKRMDIVEKYKRHAVRQKHGR